ncbi:MAG TPA: ATP-binding cassette domain-containing protein [Polyangiaceae bacterium]|nr:ATP-binding cassette domain-containing protein [Polyangiaceae bacterium]
MSAEPVLRLQGVGKRFGAREVLRGISAEVAAGAIVSLVGASGSGKTTLLRCLNGLETIDVGQIRIAGHIVEPAPSDAALTRLRADVGMVFQDYQLFPHLSVLDNLCLAPQVVRKLPRAEVEKRALTLLEQVGLGDRGGSRPSELSGGQKQRVALARALAQDVKLLLLDEPTSALDARTRDDIVSILRELVKRSAQPLTLMLVTHDVHLAETLSDEVWTLVDGRLARGES